MSFNGYTDNTLGRFMLMMRSKLGEEKYQKVKPSLENAYTACKAYIESFSGEDYEFIEEDRESYLKFFLENVLEATK